MPPCWRDVNECPPRAIAESEAPTSIQTPPRAFDSPVLAAFLRALVFVGFTEAVFYRLLPDPVSPLSPSIGNTIHASLNRAGSLTFFLAFFFVTLALGNVAYRALRHPLWPAGLNGFLSLCLLCLVMLGFSAVVTERGPLFAAAFTGLSLLTLLFIAMHAFVAAGCSASMRILAVCYGAAAICSAGATLSGTLGLSGSILRVGLPGILSGPAFATGALRAGQTLLAVAAAAAFFAFAPWVASGGRGGARRWPALTLGAVAAVGFAGGCLLAPARVALLGGKASPLVVITLSWVLFLGVVSAASNMTDPERRLRAYGILLVLLAGFPLRIAHQQLMAVLGAVLLFSQGARETGQNEDTPVGAPFELLP